MILRCFLWTTDGRRFRNIPVLSQTTAVISCNVKRKTHTGQLSAKGRKVPFYFLLAFQPNSRNMGLRLEKRPKKSHFLSSPAQTPNFLVHLKTEVGSKASLKEKITCGQNYSPICKSPTIVVSLHLHLSYIKVSIFKY